MDNRDEVKAFLSSRRAKITPEQAGLQHFSRNRRVPGLRRDEAEQQHLADLARAASPGARTRRRPPAQQVRPSVIRVLDLMADVPALCTRSEDFRARWAAHDVRLHRTGIKQFRHPVVGDLDLNFETMQLTAGPGLSMTLLSAPAGSAGADALHLLASWAATHDQSPAAPGPR